jgi:thiol reductant ABC exporter CydC subunit
MTQIAPPDTRPPARAWRVLAPSWAAAGRLSLATVSGAAALLASIGLTATAAWLIARASQHPPVLELTVAVVAVRFFGVTRPVLRYVERLVSHDAALRLQGDLRATVYQRLVPLTSSRLRWKRGDLLTGVVTDVDAVEDLYLRILEPAAVAALVCATCVAAALWVLPSLALVLVVAFLVAGLAAPLAAAAASRRAMDLLAPRRAALSGAVLELMAGAPDLIATGAVTEQMARIERLDGDLTSVARRSAWAAGLGSALGSLAAGAAVWAAAVVGSSAVREGSLQWVMLAVVVLAPLAAFEALTALPQSAVRVAHLRTSVRRLCDLVDADPAVVEPATADELPAPPYPLVLRDVQVRWSRDHPLVLTGLSLTLPPGHRVAVVGESGSGKSTLAAVLLRFLPVEAGAIQLGGTDIGRLASDDARRIIGLVDDDPHIFGSTLRANLDLARPGAPDDALEAAVRGAYLGHWYDGLPLGLDTWLGQGGASVSGGEKRRLALARALLADQPVLLLDEPTEGLDQATAEALMGDLLDASSGRSVLLLTHRTEGLDLVDEVLELRAGRLQPVHRVR